VAEAEEDVRQFLEAAAIELIPITAREAETALSAFLGMAKDAAIPLQLNLGDCFAYAAAKNHRRALLFKGDDFDKTDIRSESRPRSATRANDPSKISFVP
jgi:ribonuclease VapC